MSRRRARPDEGGHVTIQDPHEAIAKARCPCGHLIIPLHAGACVVQDCGCEDGLPTALLRWHVAEAARIRRETQDELADQLDARAARYRVAARSAHDRADRLGLGRPSWSRAIGMEAWYAKRAERFRIGAAAIRETRQDKP